MTKLEILKPALEARENDILGYQINIDNYTLAIAKMEAENDPDLFDFCKSLKELLKTEKLEQKKSKIIYDVIKQQLEL